MITHKSITADIVLELAADQWFREHGVPKQVEYPEPQGDDPARLFVLAAESAYYRALEELRAEQATS